jgi:hypothetical protein
MYRRYRIAAALMLAACATSCGDSNPFNGKWELVPDSNDACKKDYSALEVTDKSLRSDQGIWLYTLTDDGDDYIFDVKHKAPIVARAGKNDTMVLNFGPYQCTMRRPTKK